MKKLALTTLVLLAGTAMAAAQGTNAQQQGGNKAERAAPAPQAQQKAPAEKMGSSHQAQSKQSKPAETTGQASKDADTKSGADMKANQSRSTTGQKADDKAGANKATTGQNDKTLLDQQKNKSSMDNKANDKTKSSMDNKANNKTNAANNNKQQNTTGQGAAGGRGAANLTTEQKTKIRTVVKEKVHAQPLRNVNFSVSVGTVVPRSVHFYPLPAEVVTIYPQWRGYEFILVNDEIIIIEPSSYRIVAIIA